MFEPKDGMVLTTNHPALREAHMALAILNAYLTGVVDASPNASNAGTYRDMCGRAIQKLEEAVS